MLKPLRPSAIGSESTHATDVEDLQAPSESARVDGRLSCLLLEAPPLPSFLEPMRAKIAESFNRPAEAFTQVLINEYRPGARIGWHRDKPQFDEIVGVSLLAPCVMRFRRRSGETWERRSLTVEPRSAYLLAGPARTIWEHSIPAVDRHRYSITFRTLVAKTARVAS